MKNGKALTVVALAALCCHVVAADGNTVRASSFGWNGKDDTKALQKAFDSGAATVVVDRVSGSWVTRPLFARSNQTIIFERGCVLEAKKGEFMGLNDCLFSCWAVTNLHISGYGATWRMHRADYDAAPYKKGEWRHSLSILASSNVTVEGLMLLESGGDGVYVGTLSRLEKGLYPSTDITLRDLVCERHYRQGISIITAKRLLIERCVMRNTWGTPPAAGIDFEPNHYWEHLSDCVMRDCVSENNQGCGFELFLGQLNAETPPISLTIERFRSRNNKRGATIATYFKNTYPKGSVRFRDCEFVNERGTGLTLSRKPASSIDVVFEKCLFDNCQAAAPRADLVNDVSFSTRNFDDPTTDGLEFRDCTVRMPIKREWISRGTSSLAGEPVHAVRGTVTVETPAGAEKLTLDPAWCAGYFGKPLLKSIPPQNKFDASAAKPVDKCPGKTVKLKPFNVRKNARYRFYAASAGTVNFTGGTIFFGRKKLKPQKMTVRDLSGKTVCTLPCPLKRRETFSVKVPAAGFYDIELKVPGVAFVLETSDVPVALDMSGPVNFLGSEGTLRFSAAAGTEVMTAIAGDGQEQVHAVLSDPSGKVVWDKAGISAWDACKGKSASGGFWSLKIGRTAGAPYEDCTVILRGAAPVAFLSDEKYW